MKKGKLLLADRQPINIRFDEMPTLEVSVDNKNGIKTLKNDGKWQPIKFKSKTNIILNGEESIGFITNNDIFYYKLYNPIIEDGYIKFDRCQLI